MPDHKRLNWQFLLALILTVPEGLGEISKLNKWNNFKVENQGNNNNNNETSTASSTTSPSTEQEAQRRSNNQAHYYESLPQYYGQQCSYSGGKIVCKHRRGDGAGESGSGHVGGGMDTYAAAAASYGVPAPSYGVPMAMASGGWGMDDDEGEGSLGGIGELAGIIGLLGLKGLKGAKGLIALLPIILPLILPLLLPFLILLAPILLFPFLFPLLLLFIPIPVMGTGRHRAFNETSRGPSTIPEFVIEFLNSDLDQCLERVSCEVANVGKTFLPFRVDSVIERIARSINLDSLFKVKIRKGLTYLTENEGRSGKSCSQLSCNLQKISTYKKKPIDKE